jgi:hypothetical protein
MEIFEIQDLKNQEQKGPKNEKQNLLKQTDPHIPQFDFKGYPDLPNEFEESPRIPDETWQRYKKMSSDIAGASALRSDSEFLERLINIF